MANGRRDKDSSDDMSASQQMNQAYSNYQNLLNSLANQQAGQAGQAQNLPNRLNQDLGGYKKGGKVKKTGPAKVHKGEYVINKAAAKKAGPRKLAALNRGRQSSRDRRDMNMLKRTPFR